MLPQHPQNWPNLFDKKIIPSYFVVPPFLWSSQECEKINDNNREKPFRIKFENEKYAKCLNS